MSDDVVAMRDGSRSSTELSPMLRAVTTPAASGEANGSPGAYVSLVRSTKKER